jgi:hypothetical protein
VTRGYVDLIYHPQEGDTLTIPAALAGHTHGCGDACPDPTGHVAVRRLADCVCGVCGQPYGFGVTLHYRRLSGRWYHPACLAFTVTPTSDTGRTTHTSHTEQYPHREERQ